MSQGRARADLRRSVTSQLIELHDLITVAVSGHPAPNIGKTHSFREFRTSNHQVCRELRTPVLEPPKLRHSVTSFQGLDLRVTQFFGIDEFATYPLWPQDVTCDAIFSGRVTVSAIQRLLPFLSEVMDIPSVSQITFS